MATMATGIIITTTTRIALTGITDIIGPTDTTTTTHIAITTTTLTGLTDIIDITDIIVMWLEAT